MVFFPVNYSINQYGAMNNVNLIYIFVVLSLNAQLISNVMMDNADFDKFLWLLVPSYST